MKLEICGSFSDPWFMAYQVILKSAWTSWGICVHLWMFVKKLGIYLYFSLLKLTLKCTEAVLKMCEMWHFQDEYNFLIPVYTYWSSSLKYSKKIQRNYIRLWMNMKYRYLLALRPFFIYRPSHLYILLSFHFGLKYSITCT